MIAHLASAPHYRAHLEPILARLPDDSPEDVCLVASHADLRRARGEFRRIVLAQHGAGQSYGGDPRSARNPAYPGGDDNDDVGLFLVPNEHAQGRWRERYPAAAVEVVGSPRLDTVPRKAIDPLDDHPVIAVTFHWDPYFAPEARSAWRFYRAALVDLAARFKVLGHAHPRRHDLRRAYRTLNIEHVADFDEVCRRADVLVFDNTSAGFEFAATGRPVVVLNSPEYRRDVAHGLRFWDAASVGLQVNRPAELLPAVECALLDAESQQEAREAALRLVYAYREGAAQRAADAIMAWAA